MEEKFYDRLKRLRKEVGLTQGQLAEATLVHIQTISRWERGLIEPDISQIGDLAVALKVPLEKLLGTKESDVNYSGKFDAVNLGLSIQNCRQKANESQKSLADALGVSSDTVSRWERGVTCPSVGELTVLSERYDCPVSELYYGVNEQTPVIELKPTVYTKAKIIPWIISTAVLSLFLILTAIFCVVAINGNDNFKTTHVVTVNGVLYEVSDSASFTPEAPRKDGYDFVRWVDDNGKDVGFPQIINGNKTFEAVFVPHEYHIDYWLNGGEFLDQPETSVTVESQTLTLPMPIKNNESFIGWYLTPDYSGEAVSELSCDKKDVVLYAKWKKTVYTVRYDLSGGYLSGKNPETVTADKEELLANPVKKGYVFIGWVDDNGNVYDSVGGGNAKNLYLTAKWQKSDEKYSITYDAGGGVLLEENPTEFSVGEIVGLNSPKKRGYDFIGWNDSPDGSGKFYERIFGVYENLALYAVYRPKTYTIRYEYDGVYESEEVNKNVITFGETVRLLPVYKYGYEFLGWFTENNSASRIIEEINESVVDEITVLYAVFKLKTFTVALDPVGGEIEDFTETDNFKKAGDSYVYTLTVEDKSVYLPSCKKQDYVFLGWYYEDRLIEKLGAENLTLSSLVAKWERDDRIYNIEYDLGGFDAVNDNPATFLCRLKLVLSAPELIGYEFLGWYDNKEGNGNKITFIPAYNYGDVKLFALWQKIAVTGDYEDFEYSDYGTYVTIDKYKGVTGKTVTVNVPAAINGLPVTEISGFNGDFYRINIPEGVTIIGENCFLWVNTVIPLEIPASVKVIEKRAFCCFSGEIEFKKDSVLERIEDEAFLSANVYNLLVLPDTVTYIGNDAFPQTETEVVMSDGIQYIIGKFSAKAYFGEKAVKNLKTVGSLYHAFIPSGLVADEKFKNSLIYSVDKTTLNFVDGEDEQTVEGYWYALPRKHKAGYRFIGWAGEDGKIKKDLCYIPGKDGETLTAKYVKISEDDGLTASTAKTLNGITNQSIDLYIASNGSEDLFFYFTLDVNYAMRIILYLDGYDADSEIYGNCMIAILNADGSFTKINNSVEYKKGTVLVVMTTGKHMKANVKLNVA